MRSPGTTFSKRQRERAKQDKKKEKARKRDERRHNKAAQPDGDSGAPPDVDPDIADIVPGPQPLPEEDALT